jgi:hypothetical protein
MKPKKFAEGGVSTRPSVSYSSLRIAETVKGVTKNFKLYFVRLALALL